MPPNAATIVEDFLSRQQRMYEGGDLAPVEALLAEKVVWHVPGNSPIAGDYRGRQAVIEYFTARRQLAGGALTIESHQQMSRGDVVVQLADGHASLGGQDASWRTVGAYRVADGKIAEAWLVPLESASFDEAWNPTRGAAHAYRHRVRPQECAASEFLGHPSYLELFEAAFIEWWRARAGPLGKSLGTGLRLTVAEVSVEYRRPVHLDDELRIDVGANKVAEHGVDVHYSAFVEKTLVAEGRSRYVGVDLSTGRAAAFNASLLTRLRADPS